MLCQEDSRYSCEVCEQPDVSPTAQVVPHHQAMLGCAQVPQQGADHWLLAGFAGGFAVMCMLGYAQPVVYAIDMPVCALVCRGSHTFSCEPMCTGSTGNWRESSSTSAGSVEASCQQIVVMD